MTQSKSKDPTLDLHGKKTDEVVDLVDAFLMKHQNAKKVRIMTGKGTGAVQKQVVSYLKKGHFSYYFEPLPNGDKNTGVLVVPLED